jgi:hypothetical protein
VSKNNLGISRSQTGVWEREIRELISGQLLKNIEG